MALRTLHAIEAQLIFAVVIDPKQICRSPVRSSVVPTEKAKGQFRLLLLLNLKWNGDLFRAFTTFDIFHLGGEETYSNEILAFMPRDILSPSHLISYFKSVVRHIS